MSFLVPGAPGERYSQSDRVLLGNLPLLGALLILGIAGLMFFHSWSIPRVSAGNAMFYSLLAAAGSGFLYATIGALIYQR